MSLKENSSYRTVEILWVFFFTTKAMNFFEKKEMKCQTKAFPHSPWRIKKVVEGHLEEWFHSRSWSVKWKSLTFTHVRLYATPWTIQSVECLQARILEWVAFPFSRGSSQPRNWTQVSCIAGRFFTSWAIREAQKWKRRQIWYPMLNCPSSVIEWNRPRIFDLVKILPSSPDLDFMSSVLLDKVPSEVLVAQPSLALWDPMDCSPRGSSVHGILQARILEWVAMPSSRGSSQPRSPTLRADSLPSEPPGKPWTKHWVG